MKLVHSLLAPIALGVLVSCSVADTPTLHLEIDEQSIDRDESFMPHSYANMLQNATPSVVSVHTARIVKVARSQGYSQEDELLRRFFGLPSPQQRPSESAEPEERRMPQGIGSGVIISSDGYIVTNNHVVSTENDKDADEILVRLTDGREIEAQLVGRDPLTDVAILKIEAQDLPAIKIADSDKISVGDVVFAIGNPMGVGLTVTQGIVSATNRSIGIYGAKGYESFIQTDASINPGNSGGALIDSKGRLVGINSAILSRSGGNIGIGFAIPSMLTVNISQQLADSGEVKRGFLGVGIADLTPDLAEAFGSEGSKGVLIETVEEGSAADSGGIKQGDIVVGLNSKKVDTANEFRVQIGHTAPGKEIELEIIREGKPETLKLSVGEASGRFAMSANEMFEGVEVSVLDEEAVSQYRIPLGISGVLIRSIAPDSPYNRKLREGMVIININDREIESISDARDQIRPGINKVYVYDRGRTGYIALRVD